MILYDPNVPASLQEFGILIPILDSRAVNTYEALREHPKIGVRKDQWHVPAIEAVLTRDDLGRVHAPGYLNRLYSQGLADEIIKTYELIDDQGTYNRYAPQKAVRPLNELFDRILHKAAGTYQCARLSLAHGFCFYFSGGMHHAHYDYGAGFCLINDIVIAARKLQSEARVRTVWIIDTDAHKGDGTASLTADDATIRTLSIHMANGWPLDGPRQLEDGRFNKSFTPSDVDIPVEAGDDADYLQKLAAGLDRLAQNQAADLAIVVSGADPFMDDGLPSTRPLQLSLEQMLARDQMVYRFLAQRGIPAAFLMAGGYGEQVWKVYAQFLIWALTSTSKGHHQ